MRMRYWLVFLIVLATAPPTFAASTVIRGTVYTEKPVAAVEVRVWALGEVLVADATKADAPLAVVAATPGKPFSLEATDAVLPVRVEVAAASHVGATFDVVLAEQTALPPLWLPAGREAEVRVERPDPKVTARVTGAIYDSAWRDHPPGRWLPMVPWTDVGARGVAKVTLPRGDLPVSWVARAADGGWGRPARSAPESARVVRIASRPVRVEVRDERDRPVSGIAVAADSAPLGAAVRTGEDGVATIQAPATGEWTVVALGRGLAAHRPVHGGSPPALRLTARPAAELRVVCRGAPGAVLATADWLPGALTGAAPAVLPAGAGVLPFMLPGGGLQVWGPGAGVENLRLAGADAAVAARLPAPARAEGRVVDEGGAGVAGVPVWSWLIPGYTSHVRRIAGMWRPEGLQRPLLPIAVSGSDGRFMVPELLPGPQRFTAVAAGLPPADSGPLEATAGATLPVTLTLAPGAWLALTVHDPDGRAVAGALVKAFLALPSTGRATLMRGSPIKGRTDEPAAQGSCDREGKLRLAPLAPGPLTLELWAPGYVRRTVEATVAREGADLGAQVIEPGVEVTGRVLDETGATVADAEVLVEAVPGMPFGETAARTDAAGHFVIPDQPRASETRLLARGENVVPTAAVAVTLPPERPVELRVRRARALEGRVVDERDAEPVAGTTVTLTKEVRRASMGSMFSAGGAQSGEDGSFRIDGLSAGSYVLEVQARAFRRARLEVTVPEDEPPRALTVVMKRGLAIAGRVEESNGLAAAGVFVQVSSAEQEQGVRSFGVGPTVLRADPDGRFVADGLEAGRYLVSASDDAGGAASEVVEAGGREPVVLVLQRPGTLTCRVVDGDKAPVAGATVRVGPIGPAPVRVQDRITDASGTVTYTDLPAQRFRAWAEAEGLAAAWQEVKVGEGQPAEVTIVLERGGSIVGRVIGLPREQLARVRVWVRGNRTKPGDDGSFTLTGLAVGVGEVYAGLHPEGKERTARYEITAAGTPATIEIDFGSGGSIAGSVRRGGRPAVGLMVEASRGRDSQGSSVTDPDGRYRIGGVESGDIDVTVSDDAGRPLATRRLAVSGDARADFDVPGGEISGRVIDAETREPVADAEVLARQAAPPPVERSVRSAESGVFAIGELADGDYELRATAPGYAPAAASHTLAMGRGPEVTLALAPEQRLDLTFIEADGARVEFVALIPMAGGRVLDAISTSCDSRGRAVFSALAPGSYTALVMGRGVALAALRVPSAGGRVQLAVSGRLQVAIPEEASVPWRVRIVSAASGIVVPTSPWMNPERGEWVSTRGVTVAVRVPAGAYTVQAIDPAGRTHETSVTVPAGGDITARIEE